MERWKEIACILVSLLYEHTGLEEDFYELLTERAGMTDEELEEMGGIQG